MSFVTAEDLVTLRARDPNAGLMSYRDNHLYDYYVPHGVLSMSEAQNILAQNLAAALANRQGKFNRPWVLVDLFSKLDPNEMWVGMEMETGFNHQDHYRSLVNFIWDNLSYVAMDREGSGDYPIEVTFPPEEMSKFTRGESQIHKMLDFMNEERLENVVPYDTNVTGTHVNLSTPMYRSLTDENDRSRIVSVFSRSISTLGFSDKHQLFGRQPYGYCYRRSATGPSRVTQNWVEMKLFFSTTDRAVFGHYMGVIERLGMMLDKVIEAHAANMQQFFGAAHLRVSNAYDFLTGATDTITLTNGPY